MYAASLAGVYGFCAAAARHDIADACAAAATGKMVNLKGSTAEALPACQRSGPNLALTVFLLYVSAYDRACGMQTLSSDCVLLLLHQHQYVCVTLYAAVALVCAAVRPLVCASSCCPAASRSTLATWPGAVLHRWTGCLRRCCTTWQARLPSTRCDLGCYAAYS